MVSRDLLWDVHLFDVLRVVLDSLELLKLVLLVPLQLLFGRQLLVSDVLMKFRLVADGIAGPT